MTGDTENGEGIILEKPERGAKEGYLSKYYNESNALNGVIRESNGISDHRIRLMTLKMIAGITDDTIRAKAFDYFEMRINKINNTPDISADEKNQLIANFCCGEMQGHIIAFYDQFLGITHRLKLGRV
jgi:hypothetical protein